MSLRCLAIFGVLAGVAFAAEPVAEFKAKTFQYETASAPLGKVLDELTKQTGIPISADGADKTRPVSVIFSNAPFLEALEQIAKASDHQIRFADNGRKLQLAGDRTTSYQTIPLSIDRVFRVWARSVRTSINFESGHRVTEVTLAFACEPGVVVFLIDQPGSSTIARDDTGRKLEVVDPGKGRSPANGGLNEVLVRLQDVPRGSKSIALLQGQFTVVGAAQILDFTFGWRGAGKAGIATKEDITVTVDRDFDESSDLWTARVELKYPLVQPNFQSFENAAWLSQNSATLTNKAGSSCYHSTDYELASQGRTTVLKYRFKNADRSLGKPEDWVLKIRTPSRLIETDVHFKLKDVPLP